MLYSLIIRRSIRIFLMDFENSFNFQIAMGLYLFVIILCLFACFVFAIIDVFALSWHQRRIYQIYSWYLIFSFGWTEVACDETVIGIIAFCLCTFIFQWFHVLKSSRFIFMYILNLFHRHGINIIPRRYRCNRYKLLYHNRWRNPWSLLLLESR